jgi:hypothetical protein
MVLILIIAVLSLYNIIKWGDYPELGFAFRSATGVKIVGAVSEVGRRRGTGSFADFSWRMEGLKYSF